MIVYFFLTQALSPSGKPAYPLQHFALIKKFETGVFLFFQFEHFVLLSTKIKFYLNRSNTINIIWNSSERNVILTVVYCSHSLSTSLHDDQLWWETHLWAVLTYGFDTKLIFSSWKKFSRSQITRLDVLTFYLNKKT